MILKVKETNFTKDFNWLFKLTDNSGIEYFIMDDNFYQRNNRKSPITRIELDSLDIKSSINCWVEEINGFNVVTEIK